MGSMYDKTEQDPSIWITSVPELANRKHLLQAMQESRSLRRFVFKLTNMAMIISTIPDPAAAIWLMHLYEREVRSKVVGYWHDHIDQDINGDIYGELIGITRNIIKNARMRIKPNTKIPMNNKYDVIRGEPSSHTRGHKISGLRAKQAAGHSI